MVRPSLGPKTKLPVGRIGQGIGVLARREQVALTAHGYTDAVGAVGVSVLGVAVASDRLQRESDSLRMPR
jgi:hypothetical protein